MITQFLKKQILLFTLFKNSADISIQVYIKIALKLGFYALIKPFAVHTSTVERCKVDSYHRFTMLLTFEILITV